MCKKVLSIILTLALCCGIGLSAEAVAVSNLSATDSFESPFRRQERRSRNREVRPAGRLYLPEHAEDRQGRLPRGGGHRLGETQPAGGRGHTDLYTPNRHLFY